MIFDNLNGNIEALKRNLSSPYIFKGNTTFAALPASGNAINDTYYCTDKKCNYSWNGNEWKQSSISDAEYLEELNDLSIKKIGYKKYIDEPIDFYELIEHGVYNVLNSAVEKSVNYPSDVGGILTVKTRVGYDYPVSHQLTDNNNVFYTNYKTSKGWIGWKAYASKEEFDALKKEHEELMEAFETTEKHVDGIGALVDVAESYFNVAFSPEDQLVYDSTHGLYNKQMTNNAGVKAIVCSQFEQACIAGITYENSRYIGRDNKPYAWGFVSDGSGEYAYDYPSYLPEEKFEATETPPSNDYMTACEQAKYFEARGLLHTFDMKRNGLKPGDLLFFDAPDDEDNKHITDPPYYKRITHVGICLAADDRRYIMMHSSPGYIRKESQNDENPKEAGVFVATYLYTSKFPAYFVHSPITAEYTTKTLYSKVLNRNSNIKIDEDEDSAFIDEIVFDEPLQRGFYTLQFDNLGNTMGYIAVTYDTGQGLITQNYNAVKNGNVHSIVFYAELPITNIIARVALVNTEYNRAYQSGYNCSWIKLYKGYHN